MKYEVKDPDALCGCGHPRCQHFKGSGMCECVGNRGVASTCGCNRFRRAILTTPSPERPEGYEQQCRHCRRTITKRERDEYQGPGRLTCCGDYPIKLDFPRNLPATRTAPEAAKQATSEHVSEPDKCPVCDSPEIETNTPRTVYACGSSDYDQRPGTFIQKCTAPEAVAGERKPWFHATARDAESWTYAGISREEAIKSGREYYGEEPFFITTGHESRYSHDDDHDPDEFEYTMDSVEPELIAPTPPVEADKDAERITAMLSLKDLDVIERRWKIEGAIRPVSFDRLIEDFRAISNQLTTARATIAERDQRIAELVGALEVLRDVRGTEARSSEICRSIAEAISELEEGCGYDAKSGVEVCLKWLLRVLNGGAALILDERQRQISEEGWTSEHDDAHDSGELLEAAAVYMGRASEFATKLDEIRWPWDEASFKPSKDDPIRDLVKAGALIAAEIDRLKRAALAHAAEGKEQA